MDSLCNPHHLKTHTLFCSSSSPAGVDVSLCSTMLLSRTCVGRSVRWNSMGQARICSVSFCFRIIREKEWSSCFGQRHSKSSSLPLVHPITMARHLLVAWWLSLSYSNAEIPNAEQKSWKASSCYNYFLVNHLPPLSSELLIQYCHIMSYHQPMKMGIFAFSYLFLCFPLCEQTPPHFSHQTAVPHTECWHLFCAVFQQWEAEVDLCFGSSAGRAGSPGTPWWDCSAAAAMRVGWLKGVTGTVRWDTPEGFQGRILRVL